MAPNMYDRVNWDLGDGRTGTGTVIQISKNGDDVSIMVKTDQPVVRALTGRELDLVRPATWSVIK